MPKPSPHKYVDWRDGRPRFNPDKKLRGEGLRGTDLRWPLDAPARWKPAELQPGERNDGRWFSRGEAVDWSDAFVKARKRQQAATAARPSSAAPAGAQLAAASGARVRPITIEQLFDLWFASPKFQLPADRHELRRQRQAGNVYSAKTVVDYKQKAGVIEQEDTAIWYGPADALTTPVVFSLYEDLVSARGIASARGAIAVLSIALSWGKKRGKVTFRLNHGANPAKGLDMATPPPRLRIATRAEISALVAAADALGRPELGDCIMLGLWTGQRQGDRLELEDRGLLNGRRIFKQSKTGAIVAIREAPELKRRLAAAMQRRRGARAAELLAASPEEAPAIERRFSRVILNETVDPRFGKCFWRPYQSNYYSHEFAELRALAAKGYAGPHGEPVEPCPSLLGDADTGMLPLLEMDLRDTAVTWMAQAGATIPEIIAVTGHSPQSATAVLKHYLAVNPEMADAAIAKMVALYGLDEAEAH